MSSRWVNRVRQRMVLDFLLVQPDSWGDAIDPLTDSVSEFNQRNVCVTLNRVSTGDEDIEQWLRGPASHDANIRVEALSAGQSVSFVDQNGRSQQVQLGRDVTAGTTIPFDGQDGRFMAFVFLPRAPQVPTGNTLRAAGRDVMKVIYVHEMIHASGLIDHSQGNDVFSASMEMQETNGSIKIHPWGRPDLLMPPVLWSDDTRNRIRQLWCQTASVTVSHRPHQAENA